MEMQHQIHPDDERLAALAGGDPEVVADAQLRAHVSGCSRCSDLVKELTTMRSARAELPDLVPSRRLQLIPPVAEPRTAASSGWLRRLAAPIMAAGFGLVLVGAVGTSGLLNMSLGSASASAAEAITQDFGSSMSVEAGGEPGSEANSSEPRSLSGDMTSEEPRERSSAEAPKATDEDDSAEVTGGSRDSGAGSGLFSTSDPRLPWLVVIGFGVGLLLAGVYLRFSAQPRVG